MTRTLHMTLAFVLAVVAMLLFGSLNPVAADGDGWESISDEDGIRTYRKEMPGSDVVAFRGEALVNAPFAKVANVLIDVSRKKEWVAKIAEAKEVRPINDYERIEYNHTYSGFFAVKDRDFVFRAKVEFDDKQQQMIIRLTSVEDPLMPEGDPVRGELKASKYVLTSRDGGAKTYVEVEIHADPKGSLPKWLVNLFQKSWPRTTLANIRKQAAKSDVPEHPGVKAYIAKWNK